MRCPRASGATASRFEASGNLRLDSPRVRLLFLFYGLTWNATAVLHPSLDSNTLYKHIAVDIFPILRMHQLLLWCFQRRNELMEGHEPAFGAVNRLLL